MRKDTTLKNYDQHLDSDLERAVDELAPFMKKSLLLLIALIAVVVLLLLASCH